MNSLKHQCRYNMPYVEWTGIAISSCPKNSFWNPSEPGLIIPATEGVSLPIIKQKIPRKVKSATLKHKHKGYKRGNKKISTNHKGSRNQASSGLEAAYNCKIKLEYFARKFAQWPLCEWEQNASCEQYKLINSFYQKE